MPVLALDTSACVAVAVLDDDGATLSHCSHPGTRQHAELLTPLIRAALADAGAAPRELGTVVVGTGPAPFTGLRVGLVTARTLGLALGVPVLGVPSLDAMALRALDRFDLADEPPAEVLVVTDARRREVYWGRYVRDAALGVRCVDGPGVGPAGSLGDAEAIVGRGLLLHGDALPEARLRDEQVLDPDPSALATLGLARAARGELQPTHPLYLRRPDAVPTAQRVTG